MEEIASFVVAKPLDMEKVASWILSRLQVGTWIGLEGDLGAGKTTFMQYLVAACQDQRNVEKIVVTSPTFDIYHQYPTTPNLIHYDVYRLTPDTFPNGGAFLASIDWEQEERTNAVTFVEWPDRLPEEVEEPAMVIQIVRENRDERRILVFK